MISFTILSDTTVVLQWIYKCHLFRLPLSGSYSKDRIFRPFIRTTDLWIFAVQTNHWQAKCVTWQWVPKRRFFWVYALYYFITINIFFGIFVFLYFFFLPFLKLLISQNVKWTLDIFQFNFSRNEYSRSTRLLCFLTLEVTQIYYKMATEGR